MYHTPGSMETVRKFMKPLQIGVLDEETYPKKRDQLIEEDFKKLWKTAEEMVKKSLQIFPENSKKCC